MEGAVRSLQWQVHASPGAMPHGRRAHGQRVSQDPGARAAKAGGGWAALKGRRQGRPAKDLMAWPMPPILDPPSDKAQVDVDSLWSSKWDFNDPRHLEGAKVLPRSLQTLTFGDQFNQSLALVDLPSSLQSLTFGKAFNKSLEHVTLPCSLKSLTFGHRFNQSLQGVTFPNNLQILTLGAGFVQNFQDVSLPEGLKSLSFGAGFNQNLDLITWPSGLESLSFGELFDQPLHRVSWPCGLQVLVLGAAFNQSLDLVSWPKSLRHLTLGEEFDQTLENVTLPGLELPGISPTAQLDPDGLLPAALGGPPVPKHLGTADVEGPWDPRL
eukprot:Skav222110  [mRNA]  locus=scaffold1181:188992:192195:- [translate_table: standard]